MKIICITTEIGARRRIWATVTLKDYDGEVVARQYHTNADGDGLWLYTGRGESKQLIGTGQFSAKNRRQMRDGLRRHLSQ